MIDLQPSAGPALIVGGGTVAARKVRGLLAAGFACTIIAPEILPALRDLPAVTLVQRPFEPGDLDASSQYSLAFACTGSREVNAEVSRLARCLRIPVVIADSQPESTFFTPAVFRDGDLIVAIATGGASPTIARSIRDRVAEAVGSGWASTLAAAREDREGRLARREPTTSEAPTP